jgi:hypothetical protein
VIQRIDLKGSRDASLFLFGVTEEKNTLTAQAFMASEPLRKGRVFRNENETFELLETIPSGNFLYCRDVNTDKDYQLLRRKNGK